MTKKIMKELDASSGRMECKVCEQEHFADRTIIAINHVDKTFFYTGTILEDDGDFITFEDVKVGIIKLNKIAVISIRDERGSV